MACVDIVLGVEALRKPFQTEPPFLFAVYHLDFYPAGNASMRPDPKLLRGRSMGQDFGDTLKTGWNMYHGKDLPGFPRHAHRGFETITVTRRGIVDHADSLGCTARFGFGDVQWMTAGSGISHSETFPLLNMDRPNPLEFFQIWINLPRRSKMVKPSFKMLWREDLPAPPVVQTEEPAPEVALIAGVLSGFDAPPSPPPDSYACDASSDVLVVTVKLAAGTSWVLPKHEGNVEKPRVLNRNLYFYAGPAVSIGGHPFTKHRKVKVRADADCAIVNEGTEPVEVLVLQGRDIGEPVVQHGPFVGNTRADIQKAFVDYQRDSFGGWPWPSSSPVHDRTRERFAQYSKNHVEERPIPAGM